MASDDIPVDSRELLKKVKPILNVAEQETYAINTLLSQDTFQEEKSERDEKNEIKNTMCADDYCDVGDGGNKFCSDETNIVQGTYNHLAGSPAPYNSDLTNGEAVDSLSTTSGLIAHQPLINSNLTNGERKKVPISSGEAITCKNPSFKEIVTKAPAKDDCPSHEKSDAPTRDQVTESALVSNKNVPDDDEGDPFRNIPWELIQSLRADDLAFLSKSFVKSVARRYQLQESALVSNQNLCNSNVTYPFSKSDSPTRHQLSESLREENKPALKIPEHLEVPGMDASGQHSSLPSHSEFADAISLKDYNLSSSAVEQHGASNNNTYRNRNSNLPHSAVTIVPSSNSSSYGFSTPGYNTVNSFQHQNGHNDSRVQSESLIPGHQNQQSPSFRLSQQEQEQNAGTDPSDDPNQTQQQP